MHYRGDFRRRWRDLWWHAALLVALLMAATVFAAAVWSRRDSRRWRLAGMCFLPGMAMSVAILARAIGGEVAGTRHPADCRLPVIGGLAERRAAYHGLAKRGS